MEQEIWKLTSIKGKTPIEISSFGNARVLGKTKLRSQRLTTKGYPKISVHVGDIKKSFVVHRLVAIAFIPNPGNKPHVNHKDTDKTNNHYSNLEWNTPSENNKHYALTGKRKRSKRKISDVEEKTILKMLLTTSRLKVCRQYNLPLKVLNNIIRGRRKPGKSAAKINL